jgi:hypothetical protein
MPKLENVVAVDWRSGDRCYFFFKDNNTYTRFDIGTNNVPQDIPPKSTPAIGDSFTLT